MLESIQNENLEYQKLSQEEMKARGILGRLIGVCADFKQPTRNGRLYSEDLWEKVFSDPIMQERIQNGVCYGELGHPEDREETDMEKIAVCLSDVPKKGKDGKLRAVFDIMDTPNGRILKSLCDYGSTLGISSRGSGDLVTGFNGQEEVDPSSYNCEGFDVVLIPAVKEARLQYVNESLDKKRYNKTLRQKLQESLDTATPEDRKVMQESLGSIGISLKENYFKTIEYYPADSETGITGDKFGIIEVVKADTKEDAKAKLEFPEYADTLQTATEEEFNEYQEWLKQDSLVDEQLQKTTDPIRKQRLQDEIDQLQKDADWAEDHNNPGGVTKINKEIEKIEESSTQAVVNDEAELINELQESIKTIKNLKNQVIELQEKLSVCYSKEANQEDEINSLKEKISNLSNVSKTNESLKQRVKSLTEDLTKAKDNSSEKDLNSKKLKESLNGVIVKYNKLVDVHNELKENYSSIRTDCDNLKEELENAKLEIEKNKEDYANKLSNSNALVEKYKKAATSAADRYISSQAVRIGVTPQEIKNKLPEKYTFEDVDSICESLVDYNLNISKLPFQTPRKLSENVKINATSPKDPILPDSRVDDDVDDLLKMLSGMRR